MKCLYYDLYFLSYNNNKINNIFLYNLLVL